MQQPSLLRLDAALIIVCAVNLNIRFDMSHVVDVFTRRFPNTHYLPPGSSFFDAPIPLDDPPAIRFDIFVAYLKIADYEECWVSAAFESEGRGGLYKFAGDEPSWDEIVAGLRANIAPL